MPAHLSPLRPRLASHPSTRPQDADEIAAIRRAIGADVEGEPDGALQELDREGFVRLMTSKAITDFDKPEKELLSAFEAIDTDGDGVLTRDEVLSAMERVPGEDSLLKDCEAMFDALDVDKSGTLDYEEFVAMMSGTRLEKV